MSIYSLHVDEYALSKYPLQVFHALSSVHVTYTIVHILKMLIVEHI